MSKVCSKCKVGNQFKAVVRRPAIIEINSDGTATIIKEGSKFKFEVTSCNHCGQTLTEADIVDLVECSDCGAEVSPLELEDGKCISCITKERQDLAGLSQAAYIKRILELEKELKSKQGPKIENKVEAAVTNTKAEEKEEVQEKPKTNSRSKKTTTPQEAPVEPKKETASTDEPGGLTPPVLASDDPF